MTLLIASAKMLPFSFLTSKHRHSKTVNVLCHVSATSFPPGRDFRNSPKKVYFNTNSIKVSENSINIGKKIFWKVKSQVEVLPFGAYVFES